jgi:hypothetical protein
MRTKEQYIEGLRKMKRNLYFNGSKIDRDDEEQLPALNVMGFTFEAPHIPEYKDLCTAKSHLTGETINRFCHVHQNPQDLHNKQDMTRTLCRTGRMCIQRCMGTDALNAVNAASFEADKQNNGSTQYHKNYLKWLENFQRHDLVGSCAQTDMKGERLKRPAEQTDPDMYLRVVEKKSDGKGHQSAHVIIPDTLKRHLKAFLSWKQQQGESVGDDDFLFIGQRGAWTSQAIQQIVKKYLRKLGLYERGKSVHSLRHSYAVELYSKMKDLRAVQKQLRHVSIQSTIVYADVPDESISNLD